MKVVANSVPKSGTHLLDRLLTLLGFDLIDLGGIRPHCAQAGKNLTRHVGLEPDERTISTVEENIFGVSNTFRKGQIGGWREEFSEEHARAAREIAGPLLVELGYEADPEW